MDEEALGSRLMGGGKGTVPFTDILSIICVLTASWGTLKGMKAPPVSLENWEDMRAIGTGGLERARVTLTLIRLLTTMAPALTMGLWGIPGETQPPSLISHGAKPH